MTNKPADVPAVTLGDELSVSAIGFGAMALTPVYGEVDDTESLATLHRCLDLGVTFIDTANVYGGGNNERLISRLLADRRDDVTLATKFGIESEPGRPGGRRPGGPRGRRLRAQVHRREPGAVEDRCRRPLLHASPRPVGAHRGDRRGDGRAGDRGQGAPPGVVGGDRRRVARRGRRASDRRRAERMVDLEPRRRAQCRADGRRAGRGLRAVLAAGAGLS